MQHCLKRKRQHLHTASKHSFANITKHLCGLKRHSFIPFIFAQQHTTMKRHTFVAYYCFTPCILNRTYFRLKCVGLYINRICPNIRAIARDSFRKFFDLSTPHQGVCQCAFCKTGRKFISFQVVKNINGQILSLCCKRLFSSVLVLHQNVNAIKFVSISPKLLGVLILLYIVVTTGMVLL